MFFAFIDHDYSVLIDHHCKPLPLGLSHPKLKSWWENNTCILDHLQLSRRIHKYEEVEAIARVGTTTDEAGDDEDIPPKSPEVSFILFIFHHR